MEYKQYSVLSILKNIFAVAGWYWVFPQAGSIMAVTGYVRYATTQEKDASWDDRGL